ncbi:MAG: bifunctional (p)ppGpp synthetase/guanosine-3',5'-bis(diphosphate) 3'-pyrophosphohydrolase [Clostridia bacterium]
MDKEEFLKKIKKIYGQDSGDYLAIEFAVEFAEKAHFGQKRNSGEDYIIHPLAVANILIDLNMDVEAIIAALLHDVIEDTQVTEEEIKSKFGASILQLVEGVTKLTRLPVTATEEETQCENIRNMFLAMSKDIRVLFVKLADRLHNMRTLEFVPDDKKIKKSRETIDIYAPLAGRLGISWIKCELEDLSMKYLYPEDYKYLVEKVAVERTQRMVFVDKIADRLRVEIKDVISDGYEIKGRPKHLYSIYKKMKDQGKAFEQIYDLIALRVIVNDIRDCYAVLGIIHSLWKPIPGRFKDYIAVPKPNMYQSLHTTVITDYGEKFEIQIRTFEMNRIAEYGIAAHWKYKEGIDVDGKEVLDVNLVNRFSWIKEMMDVQGELKNSIEFVDTLKSNVVSTGEIYVFSPKGNVFNMEPGSTCIDFAYRVHSAVGNKCVGAKINKKMVPLSTILKNGDIVEIITNNQSKGPSRDWLKIAITNTAKAKIKSFYKKAMKEENIKLGKDMIDREAKRKGYNLGDLTSGNWIKVVLDRYRFSSTEDMYASIGYGGITTHQILGKLIDFYKKSQDYQEVKIETTEGEIQKKVRRVHSGIIIEGYDDFLIKLSHCCNPVPGDEIVGYITRGRGVMVHRADCPNVRNMEKERIISAEWAHQDNSVFIASIKVECENKNIMLSQVSATIANLNLNIDSLVARSSKDKSRASIIIGVEIKSSEDVTNVIRKLSSIKGIISVYRDK